MDRMNQRSNSAIVSIPLHSNFILFAPYFQWQLDQSSIYLVLAYYHGPFGYFSTITRATNFFAGALLATLVMDRAAMATLICYRRLAVVATILAAGMWLILAPGSRAFMGPPQPEKMQPWSRISSLLLASLGYHGSAGLSILISMCLLVKVFLFPHAAASQMLGLLRPLAPLTFRAYLLHIPLMYWVEAWFLPSGTLRRMVATAPLTSLTVMIAGVWAASFGAAFGWQGLDSLCGWFWKRDAPPIRTQLNSKKHLSGQRL